ncbi:MAG: GNAT family N-acetyltransferase [Cytophagales bacterium]|nr:GNAT family N-acetyltransferase [Cytophagales bacterium]
MEEGYTIRQAVESDAVSIKCLLEELENREFDQAIFDRIYTEYVDAPLTLMKVAVSSETEIVGLITCKGQSLLHHEGMVFEIQELIVTAAHQGNGIGRKLIEALRPELFHHAAISLEVTTNKRRKEAHAFYQSVGFMNSHEKFTIYF